MSDVDAELSFDVIEEHIGAGEVTRNVGADLEVVLPLGMLVIHLVERRDLMDQGRGHVEREGDRGLSVDRQVAELVLHQMEHREQRGLPARVARDELLDPRLDLGIELEGHPGKFDRPPQARGQPKMPSDHEKASVRYDRSIRDSTANADPVAPRIASASTNNRPFGPGAMRRTAPAAA